MGKMAVKDAIQIMSGDTTGILTEQYVEAQLLTNDNIAQLNLKLSMSRTRPNINGAAGPKAIVRARRSPPFAVTQPARQLGGKVDRQ